MKKRVIILFLILCGLFIGVIYLYFSQWNMYGYSKYINVDVANTGELAFEGMVDNKDIYTYDVTLYKISFIAKEESFCDYLKHWWINKKNILQGFKNKTNNSEYIKYRDDDNLCAYETGKYIIFTTKNNSFSKCDRIIQLNKEKNN